MYSNSSSGSDNNANNNNNNKNNANVEHETDENEDVRIDDEDDVDVNIMDESMDGIDSNPYSTMSFNSTNNSPPPQTHIALNQSTQLSYYSPSPEARHVEETSMLQHGGGRKLSLLYSDTNIQTVDEGVIHLGGGGGGGGHGGGDDHESESDHPYQVGNSRQLSINRMLMSSDVVDTSLAQQQQQQQQQYNSIKEDDEEMQQHQQHQQQAVATEDDGMRLDQSTNDMAIDEKTSGATTPTTTSTHKKKKTKSKFSLKSSKRSSDNLSSPTMMSDTVTTPPDQQLINTPKMLQFPYDLSTLTWDNNFLRNKENIYCYACGKDQDNNMIRCDNCYQLFHTTCVHVLTGSEQMAGDWVYRFSCSVCTKGHETFERFAKNWVDVLEIVLYNLQLQNDNQFYFSLDEDIIPMVDQNWQLLCSDKKKKPNWQKPLLPALTDGHIFKSGAVNINKPGYWALGTQQLRLKDNPVFKNKVLASMNNKKKKKKKKSVPQEQRFKHLNKLLLLPLKDSNYVPTVQYDKLCVALQNSAPQIVIDQSDMLTCSNQKGYRMAKASFPCVTGAWYYEVEIIGNTGSTRLGWSSAKGDKQANVGYDQHSYSYRSQQGDIFHKAKSLPYGQPFGPNDVIGFYISLPVDSEIKTFDNVDQLAVYEMVKKELEDDTPAPIEGSEIRFFKNGVSPGVAFKDIGRAMYYPAASMYMGGAVRFNFGPTFKYPPQGISGYRPFSDIKSGGGGASS
ncbi:hypothetical protein SAMD00019534_087420 [Acytostelium subglobosum LB1]|uniref:hypothetical protein n=1 Tax=Acytostelium subglobosum LB1 TaxID=1410327 RepID=UPI00064511AA|nr:hypothetical protein SAMD00019534_087420 [Acytostelium subglobosum LB1]GAM25567.1 hypothetical protein SAMD00019534_087420 [Acytostelium subglobosum LB1]|eukprot:XP_012751553.1 hypothetical protein SAMD00019534_087420 [Acytostelium subglobosum LB1]